MRALLNILLCLTLLVSCKDPEARNPVSHTSGSFIKSSIERNKQLNEQEYSLIQEIIKNDTHNEYLNSPNGFWYSYDVKVEGDSITARFGDELNYNYNVKNLKGQLIYSETELGIQNYLMDQEELFSGLREGLKLMKASEKITFIFPSQKAYGYYGDENKIGTNVPLICTVTLNSIKQKEANENEIN
jgi:gliding motility-associated peptidyl-prolyl isomerase